MPIDEAARRAWVRSQLTPRERRLVAVFDALAALASRLRGRMRA